MKIVTAVAATAKLDDDDPELLDDGTDVDPDYLDWDLNEWDAFSLEAAVQLRELHGGEVVVITVADDESGDDVLRECLAKGADRAVRVWDDAARGGDALTVARLLAPAVEREAPDLILCGVQSSDHAGGAVGAALSSHLGVARTAVVKALEVDSGARTVTVTRELEGGVTQNLRLGLPAVLTVQTGINEPRYASLRAIKQAEAQEIEVLGASDLGLDEADVQGFAGARVRELRRPETTSAEMLEGPVEDVAARILAIVQGRATA